MFDREIHNKLKEWSLRKDRKPLVVRGARQVGKTSAIKLFAAGSRQFICLNLEKREDADMFRRGLSIHDLLNLVFLRQGLERKLTETLLFIDEIQEVPEAVSYLRFFFEEYPELRVIAAGSNLEQQLGRSFSFPVGRVEFLPMFPCTYTEFLRAMGETVLADLLKETNLPEYAHELLMKWFRIYTMVGGMPEVVNAYSEHRDIIKLGRIFSNLQLTFFEDAEKYARNAGMVQHLRFILESGFSFAAQRIRMQGFANSMYRTREMTEAFRMLEKAMLVTLIYPATNTGLPLLANYRKAPKLIWFDTGMVNFFSRVQAEVFSSEKIEEAYSGRIAEHITAQLLLATRQHVTDKLFFWTREKKGTDAEVDFVLPVGGLLIPVEVKAGSSGKLRSLHQFLDETHHSLGVRISSGPFRTDEVKTIAGKPYRLISIPFYQVQQIREVIAKLV
jgi:uncharacterized protein